MRIRRIAALALLAADLASHGHPVQGRSITHRARRSRSRGPSVRRARSSAQPRTSQLHPSSYRRVRRRPSSMLPDITVPRRITARRLHHLITTVPEKSDRKHQSLIP
jgi:hypothetical protein